MKRKPYDTDVSDEEWAIIEPHIPPAKHGGRHRKHDMQEIINALFYLNRSGCAWRLLPHDFPPWKTVYDYFRKWRITNTWKWICQQLRQEVRIAEGRDPEPSALIIDSQSVKTTEKGAFVGMTQGSM